MNNVLEDNKRELLERGETYLRVRVRPGSPKNLVRDRLDDDSIKVDVAAAPENGAGYAHRRHTPSCRCKRHPAGVPGRIRRSPFQ